MFTKQITQTVVLFVLLVVAGILLIVLPYQYAASELPRQVLPLVGSGLFASGLTFFLVQMVQLKTR